jgi:hypothetical protein
LGVVGLSGLANAEVVFDSDTGPSSSVVTVDIDETESTEYTEAVLNRLNSIAGNGGARALELEANAFEGVDLECGSGLLKISD